jgi:hypothetical protein
MTIANEKVNPGQLRLCRDCRHWLERNWNNAEPNPCALVRWEGNHHLAPEAFRGPAGERCNGFEPAPGPGSADISQEMPRRADVRSGPAAASRFN